MRDRFMYTYTGQFTDESDCHFDATWAESNGRGKKEMGCFYFDEKFFLFDRITFLFKLRHTILKDMTECYCCYDDEPNSIYFAPKCGHVVCYKCKYRFISSEKLDCGVCRQPIEQYYCVEKF